MAEKSPIEKLLADPLVAVQANYVRHELDVLAKCADHHMVNELGRWASGPEGLRKAVAQNLLSAAKARLGPGGAAAVIQAVGSTAPQPTAAAPVAVEPSPEIQAIADRKAMLKATMLMNKQQSNFTRINGRIAHHAAALGVEMGMQAATKKKAEETAGGAMGKADAGPLAKSFIGDLFGSGMNTARNRAIAKAKAQNRASPVGTPAPQRLQQPGALNKGAGFEALEAALAPSRGVAGRVAGRVQAEAASSPRLSPKGPVSAPAASAAAHPRGAIGWKHAVAGYKLGGIHGSIAGASVVALATGAGRKRQLTTKEHAQRVEAAQSRRRGHMGGAMTKSDGNEDVLGAKV